MASTSQNDSETKTPKRRRNKYGRNPAFQEFVSRTLSSHLINHPEDADDLAVAVERQPQPLVHEALQVRTLLVLVGHGSLPADFSFQK